MSDSLCPESARFYSQEPVFHSRTDIFFLLRLTTHTPLRKLLRLRELESQN